MGVRVNPLLIMVILGVLLVAIFTPRDALSGNLHRGCGNGVVDIGEVCDGRAFKYTCEELGYPTTCTLTCSQCMNIEVH